MLTCFTASAASELSCLASCRARLPCKRNTFTASEAVRDVVIGMSDGLTVPLLLRPGCRRSRTNRIVITQVCRAAAGPLPWPRGISPRRADREHFETERAREFEEPKASRSRSARKSRRFFALWPVG